jgi:hypothetical protein
MPTPSSSRTARPLDEVQNNKIKRNHKNHGNDGGGNDQNDNDDEEYLLLPTVLKYRTLLSETKCPDYNITTNHGEMAAFILRMRRHSPITFYL